MRPFFDASPGMGRGRHAMKIVSRSNWKAALAFGVALLTLLVVGGASYRFMVNSDEDVRWVQHTRETSRDTR